MQVVNLKTRELLDLTLDDATKLLGTGEYGVPSDADIPVISPTGEAGTIKGHELGTALAENYSLTTPHHVEFERKRGEMSGAAGKLVAAGTGLARVVPGGVDWLARLSDEATGGNIAEYISAAGEEHPVTKYGTEIGGTIASLIASGGTTAPLLAAKLGTAGVSAAKGVSLLSRLGSVAKTGARVAAAPTRLALRGGAAAEGVAARLVGTGATSLPGKVAQKVIPLAARGVPAGAMWGAGQGLSAAALDTEQPFTVESAAPTVLKGALTGAAVGAVAEPALHGLGAAYRAGKSAMARRAAAPAVKAAKEAAEAKAFAQQLEESAVRRQAEKEVEVAAEQKQMLGHLQTLLKPAPTAPARTLAERLDDAVGVVEAFDKSVPIGDRLRTAAKEASAVVDDVRAGKGIRMGRPHAEVHGAHANLRKAVDEALDMVRAGRPLEPAAPAKDALARLRPRPKPGAVSLSPAESVPAVQKPSLASKLDEVLASRENAIDAIKPLRRRLTSLESSAKPGAPPQRAAVGAAASGEAMPDYINKILQQTEGAAPKTAEAATQAMKPTAVPSLEDKMSRTQRGLYGQAKRSALLAWGPTPTQLVEFGRMEEMNPRAAQQFFSYMFKELPERVGKTSTLQKAGMTRDLLVKAAKDEMRVVKGGLDTLEAELEQVAPQYRPDALRVFTAVQREVINNLKKLPGEQAAVRRFEKTLRGMKAGPSSILGKGFKQWRNVETIMGQRANEFQNSKNIPVASGYKKVSKIIKDEMNRALAAIPKKGSQLQERYLDLKSRYSSLHLMNEMGKRGTAKEIAARSPVEAGIHTGAAAALGSPLAQQATILAGTRAMLRSHIQPGIAAVSYRLSGAEALQATAAAKAITQKKIEGSVASWFGRQGASGVRKFTVESDVRGQKQARTEQSRAKLIEAAQRIRELAEDPKALADAAAAGTGDLVSASPRGTALATQQLAKIVSYLAVHSPRPIVSKHLLPHLPGAQTYPDDEVDQFGERLDAAMNPTTILDALNAGMVSREKIDTVREIYPEVLGKIHEQIIRELAERKTNISYDKAVELGRLFGLDLADAPYKSLRAAYEHGTGGPPQMKKPMPRGNVNTQRYKLETTEGVTAKTGERQ